MKWVVTGISRLTGERVVISSPLTEGKARLVMGERVVISSPLTEGKARLVMEQQKAWNHSRSAYSRLKVEPASREGSLW